MSEPVIEVVSRPAAPALAGCVAQYVGYRFEGFAPGRHQGLPSRYLTVIISLAGPVRIDVMPDPKQAPAAFTALVGGLHSAPATITHDGNQYGISVELGPLGARRLFGLPASALASTVVNLADVLGRRAPEIVDRLATAPRWGERFAVLDQVLGRVVCETRLPPPEVVRAWHRLLATGGGVAVSEVAEEIGWSRRHLSERFRAELGLSPKTAARVLRFERAVRQLRRPQRPALADVAVSCGYYDQAHLNREWRQLAGCTPHQWLAEEFPIVQDPPPAAVAS